MIVLYALNAIAAVVLGLYALHEGLMLALWARARRRRPAKSAAEPSPAPATDANLPRVTVQLPLFNERYVTGRIIEAACAIDYPPDRLQIQVLDDSTDATADIAREAVDLWRARGRDIVLVRRAHREGFKAGALTEGLRSATGEYIAIFDADFIPRPNFLRRLLEGPGCPFADPAVGFVQTRWTYLNRDQNAVTRAQAIMLDMHFVIEQPARSDAGLLMNFNGSGGVWRRSSIDDAGGWQSDTLSEDLDLSYRAELRGWKGVYLDEDTAPSEIPRDTLAFKLQQARWARGSARCVRKLLPLILRAPTSPLRKTLGALHISGYFIQPMIVLLALTTPLVALANAAPSVVSPAAGVAGLIGLLPMVSMFTAHRAQGRSPLAFLRDLPAVVAIGIGLSFSNSVALIAGLIGEGAGQFSRTPKTGARAAPGGTWRYGLRADWTAWAEAAAGLALLACAASLLYGGLWLSASGPALYGVSFTTTAALQLLNPRPRSR